MKLKNSVSIITGGSSGLGEATVRKFHSLGSKVCIFDLNNLNEVYNSSDLLILPSTFGESFPNVIAEAMMCGVKCVSNDIGDAKNIISNYKNSN